MHAFQLMEGYVSHLAIASEQPGGTHTALYPVIITDIIHVGGQSHLRACCPSEACPIPRSRRLSYPTQSAAYLLPGAADYPI
ncbi:hypothetical protein FKM82_021201 [Ascaphus truei]